VAITAAAVVVIIYYIYVHKVDAQGINIKWRAWPQARLALAEYTLALTIIIISGGV